MSYAVKFNQQFSVEFSNFQAAQQDAVLKFVEIFEEHGLGNFDLYEGKISPSWSGKSMTASDYAYTKDNDMWHYHVGLPEYRQIHPKFKTSDVVLHFEWPGQGPVVHLVDVYDHYRADGSFYIPPPSYLVR